MVVQISRISFRAAAGQLGMAKMILWILYLRTPAEFGQTLLSYAHFVLRHKARAVGGFEIVAGDGVQHILPLLYHDGLTGLHRSVAVAVTHHQCAAAFNELYKVRVVVFRACHHHLAGSAEVISAMQRGPAVYFAATGGAGALISRCIKKAEVAAFEDLGPEAIYRLEIEDLPLVVAIDCYGKSLY